MNLAAQAAPERQSYEPRSQFAQDVLAGLGRNQKQLSPKYFYDDAGSQFFDQICNLEEYYPYRTELDLLPRVAKDLARLLPRDVTVVEFGAGSLKKIQPLLNTLPNIREFIATDICGAHLRSAANTLQQAYPELTVTAIEADFTQPVALGHAQRMSLGFFPGSTIGNFSPTDAIRFLHNARDTLGANGQLLIGVDTKKSPEILHRAYNDAQGVTAQFNLNILQRINRELDGDINLDLFEHYAHYSPALGCIQMHLLSLGEQTASIDGEPVHFKSGESIHTESSYKYTPEEFKKLAGLAGWRCKRNWLATDDLFAVYLLESTAL